jgi:hypothetical protein
VGIIYDDKIKIGADVCGKAEIGGKKEEIKLEQE